jgi:hypothetical protein
LPTDARVAFWDSFDDTGKYHHIHLHRGEDISADESVEVYAIEDAVVLTASNTDFREIPLYYAKTGEENEIR